MKDRPELFLPVPQVALLKVAVLSLPEESAVVAPLFSSKLYIAIGVEEGGVGGSVTVTVAEALVVPPVPVQARL